MLGWTAQCPGPTAAWDACIPECLVQVPATTLPLLLRPGGAEEDGGLGPWVPPTHTGHPNHLPGCALQPVSPGEQTSQRKTGHSAFQTENNFQEGCLNLRCPRTQRAEAPQARGQASRELPVPLTQEQLSVTGALSGPTAKESNPQQRATQQSRAQGTGALSEQVRSARKGALLASQGPGAATHSSKTPTLPPGSVGALRSLHLITNENALVGQAWA